jgi:hypothetical protein
VQRAATSVRTVLAMLTMACWTGCQTVPVLIVSPLVLSVRFYRTCIIFNMMHHVLHGFSTPLQGRCNLLC